MLVVLVAARSISSSRRKHMSAPSHQVGKPCHKQHADYVVGCRTCWLAEYDAGYRAKWGIVGPVAPRAGFPPKSKPERHSLPCIHEGAVIEWCETCKGVKAELRHVRDCEVHDRCTRGRNNGAVRACVQCPDYRPDYGVNGSLPGVKIVDGLTKNLSGFAFNAGLIRWRGRLLLAHRDGWSGSNIHIADLDESYRVTGTRLISGLTRRESNYGREDPRLFIHNDRLYLAYIGVHGVRSDSIWTYQCFARLNDDLTVEQTFAPRAPGRNQWEKNWGFFSHAGELYAVYTVAPHRILRISEHGTATWAYEAPTGIRWLGGELRGGAPPVLMGDEYWHFIHDRIEVDGLRIYRTGLYTFSASPPFEPRRYIPNPILVADPQTKPSDQYAAVLFTCGALFDEANDHWKLSSGIHDRWIEVHTLSRTDLEQQLISLPTTPAAPADGEAPVVYSVTSDACDKALIEFAARCDRVAVATVANASVLLHALTPARPRSVVCYSPDGDVSINDAALRRVSCDPGMVDIEATEMLIIDVAYSAQATYALLARLAPKASKYIAITMTTTYGDEGDDGTPGIMFGVGRFLRSNRHWSVVQRVEDRPGLVVLSRVASDKPSLPSFGRMSWNYATAQLDRWLRGVGYLPLPQVEERLQHCWVCPLRSGSRCTACGCYLDSVVDGIRKGSPGRAFFPNLNCPIGKWPAPNARTSLPIVGESPA